jgi:hypothetical protein
VHFEAFSGNFPLENYDLVQTNIIFVISVKN